MEAPQEVQVGRKDEVNKNIKHEYAYVRASDKPEALRRFLDLGPDMRGIIFCRTKMDAQTLATDLRKLGYGIDAIHGDLTQSQRDKVMGLFKTHTINLLAATDVAARGIDVKDLSHVIHFALPDDPEYYTHRSGRTARAGQRGTSLALITKRDLGKIKSFENGLKIHFEKVQVPLPSDIRQARIDQWAMNMTTAKTESGVTAEVLDQVETLFASFSKEQLIHKLIALEMDKLGSRGSDHDLNVREKERQSRGEKRNRPDRQDEKAGQNRGGRTHGKDPKGAHKMVRFMMNVGRKERVNKANLLQFICTESGLSKRQVGTIEIQDRRSYFEVPVSEAKSLPSKFKDVEVNSRALKVVIC